MVLRWSYICIYYLQCNELDDVDVQIASTPAEVINECDITLACLSDSFAVKEVTAMSTYPTERKRSLESYFAKFGTVELAKIICCLVSSLCQLPDYRLKIGENEPTL